MVFRVNDMEDVRVIRDSSSQQADSAPVPEPVDRILRIGMVCEVTGLGKSTLYRMMREGKFPPARRISSNSIGWRLSEVNAWMDQLPVN